MHLLNFLKSRLAQWLLFNRLKIANFFRLFIPKTNFAELVYKLENKKFQDLLRRKDNCRISLFFGISFGKEFPY